MYKRYANGRPWPIEIAGQGTGAEYGLIDSRLARAGITLHRYRGDY